MHELFNSVYKKKKVFITGHTGFKGSWLACWLTHLGADVTGFSLPARTSPSHMEVLKLDVKSYFGDICDAGYLNRCMKETEPDIIFHLAAQSLVRDSYRDPLQTYQTNVVGTLNVLEAARKTPSVSAIINVTTDKVYENKEWNWPYREIDPLGGYDLYSSSKACSEILTASYRNSFFNTEAYGSQHQVLIASARAGNVVGGGDWAAERLIPDVVRASVEKQTVQVRYPNAVRPWQHVLEPLSGYLLLGQRLLERNKEFSGAWNFGPNTGETYTVHEVLNKLQQYWPEMRWASADIGPEFHEASILKLDCSKAQTLLRWKPLWTIDETMQYTSLWYRRFYEQGTISTIGDLHAYVQRAREQKSNWVLS